MFPDVVDRVPTSICVTCRQPLGPEHAVLKVLTVAGVGPGPGLARTVHVNGVVELSHVRCSQHTYTWKHPDVPRRALRTGNPDYVPTRAPDYQCLFCGKVYARGDRIVEILRTEGPALDPNNIPAMRCSADYETAHKDCNYPQLLNGSGALIILAEGKSSP